jgi:alkylation response protein AidB-like acyl-CoA dehydrogenase
MLIGLSPQHQQWRDTVSGFCDAVAGPVLDGYDLDHPPSAKDWEVILDRLLGKGVIDAYPLLDDGGPDDLAFGLLLEELARTHHVLAYHTLQRLHAPMIFREMLSAEQADRYRAAFDDPRASVAGCFSEPEAGSDVRAAKTTARRRTDGSWQLKGRKIWVSGASHAQALIVYARIVDDPETDFGLFIVTPEAGYLTTPIRMMGLRAHDVCEVQFDDVVLPDVARLLGNIDGAVLGTIARARAFQGAIAVGIAQAALDAAIDYAKQHPAFGRPIGEYQLVQKLIVDAATGVMTSRLMYVQALNSQMHGSPSARMESSMAKLYGTQTAWQAVSKAMEVFGSLGLTEECGVERLFRDARMLICPDGTSQIQEMVIGRAYTGLSALTR